MLALPMMFASANSIAPVPPSAGSVVAFYASETAQFFIDSNSDLYAVGVNSHGQLGTGDTAARTSWTKVAEDVASVHFSDETEEYLTTYYISTSGYLYAAGIGGSGCLGNGSTSDQLSFVKTTLPSDRKVLSMYCVHHSAFCLMDNHHYCVTGLNTSGALGIGSSDGVIYSWTEITGPGSGAHTGISCQYDRTIYGDKKTTYLLVANLRLWTAGSGENGELGDGVTGSRNAFVQVANTFPATISRIGVASGSGFFIAEGSLYCTGKNDWGQLGLGHTAPVSSFTQVTSMSSVKEAFISSFGGRGYGVALTTAGDLYASGQNDNSCNGLPGVNSRYGTAISYTTWTLSKTGVRSFLMCGGKFGFCLSSTYDLFSCGANESGQLGLGDTVSRTSWAATGWGSVIRYYGFVTYGGNGYSFFERSNSFLYGFGYNLNGNLGIGDNSNRVSPTLVAMLGDSGAGSFKAYPKYDGTSFPGVIKHYGVSVIYDPTYGSGAKNLMVAGEFGSLPGSGTNSLVKSNP